MSGKETTKTVIVEPDVHAAVRVLSALHDESIQDIINDAVRAQYDVERLANLSEEVLADNAAPDGDSTAVDAALADSE